MINKSDMPLASLEWEDVDVIIGRQRKGPGPEFACPVQFNKTGGVFVAR